MVPAVAARRAGEGHDAGAGVRDEGDPLRRGADEEVQEPVGVPRAAFTLLLRAEAAVVVGPLLGERRNWI